MSQRSILDFFKTSNQLEPPKKKIRTQNQNKNNENKRYLPELQAIDKKLIQFSTENKQNEIKSSKNISSELDEKNFNEENVDKKNIKLEEKKKITLDEEDDEKYEFVKKEDFNPQKQDYNFKKDACWKKNENVPYLALTKTFNEIENVSSRLKMIEILANFFLTIIKLTPEDLVPAIYLCLNKLAPDYEGVELGIGDTVLMRAIASATGRKYEQIKSEVDKKGDIGLVAETSRSNQKILFQPQSLILKNVFIKFKEISLMTGQNSVTKKQSIIQSLLIACKDCEAKYLIRSLSGKLRIGLAEQSVLLALAQAIALAESKNSRDSVEYQNIYQEVTEIIKTAYCQCPNFDKILKVYFENGYKEITIKCNLMPGIPLKPMLAQPTKGVHEVLKKIENILFTCEFKYDGERAQIHFVKDNNCKNVTIFSRNQENNTSKYPDLISRVSSVIEDSVESFILDCEAVAWDINLKQILPFQILSTRKRKDAKEEEITVQVCLYAFDLLYLNGKNLIQLPLRERRKLLRTNFKEIEGQFFFAQSKDLDSIEDIQNFLDESIKNKCEGLMIKTLDEDASYEIAKRSHKWLKLKKDYLDGIGDTLDLVVIGAYFGKGKRTGNFGGFLLACYDEDNEEYQAICKIGTGFKDEDLEQHFKFFQNYKVNEMKKYYCVDTSLNPDVWFEPVQVWEIKCADITLSPLYRAAYGYVEENKGVSLRFPRFIRVREDKNPNQATTSYQVAEIYKSQEIFKSQE